jgi:hypothetical protein
VLFRSPDRPPASGTAFCVDLDGDGERGWTSYSSVGEALDGLRRGR